MNTETRQIDYEVYATDYFSIPGTPIAYWISPKLLDVFRNSPLLGNIAAPRQGFATGDNERFLRLWFEVDFDMTQKPGSYQASKSSHLKWFPCNKGGSFRKWYGNNDRIVNWLSNGEEMKRFSGSVIRNPEYYFKKGGTWSTIASNDFSMRYSDDGFLFESKGSVCFANDNAMLLYIIGLLNTVIVKEILSVLSPTLDFHEGPLSRVPIAIDEEKHIEVNSLVDENICYCKVDWDNFETSWDFKKHPLI